MSVHDKDNIRPPGIANWRPGKRVLGTAGGIAAYGSRMAAQALYFVVLARILAQTEFGTFTGTWVMAGLCSALASMGFQVLTMKVAALRPEAAGVSIAKGFGAVLVTSPTMLAAFVCAGLLLFPEPMPLVGLLLLGTSEILLLPVLALIAGWHQGIEKIGRSQSVVASLWLARLAGLGFLALAVEPTLIEVILAHAAVTAIVTATWLALLKFDLGRVPYPARPLTGEWVEGASFCASTVALIAYTEFNQTLTMSIVGPAAAATLAVAYKLITAFSAPISVVCQSFAPRLLRASRSAAERRAFWRKNLPVIVAIAACCTLAAWTGADFVTAVFGEEYEAAAGLAKLLAGLPMIAGLRMISIYVLAASARQGTRLSIELACMIGGVLTNWLLIRSHGLSGAVIGSIIVESSTAVALALAAWRQLRTPTPSAMASNA